MVVGSRVVGTRSSRWSSALHVAMDVAMVVGAARRDGSRTSRCPAQRESSAAPHIASRRRCRDRRRRCTSRCRRAEVAMVSLALHAAMVVARRGAPAQRESSSAPGRRDVVVGAWTSRCRHRRPTSRCPRRRLNVATSLALLAARSGHRCGRKRCRPRWADGRLHTMARQLSRLRTAACFCRRRSASSVRPSACARPAPTPSQRTA